MGSAPPSARRLGPRGVSPTSVRVTNGTSIRGTRADTAEGQHRRRGPRRGPRVDRVDFERFTGPAVSSRPIKYAWWRPSNLAKVTSDETIGSRARPRPPAPASAALSYHDAEDGEGTVDDAPPSVGNIADLLQVARRSVLQVDQAEPEGGELRESSSNARPGWTPQALLPANPIAWRLSEMSATSSAQPVRAQAAEFAADVHRIVHPMTMKFTSPTAAYLHHVSPTWRPLPLAQDRTLLRYGTASRPGPTVRCSSPSSPTSSCRSFARGCARTANTPVGPRYGASWKASSASTHAACAPANKPNPNRALVFDALGVDRTRFVARRARRSSDRPISPVRVRL